jgi:hypothetical protein
VRTLHEFPAYAEEFKLTKATPEKIRASLVSLAKGEPLEGEKKGEWYGYSHYGSLYRAGQRTKNLRDLSIFFIEKYLGVTVGRWIRDNSDPVAGHMYLTADIVISTFLFRYCADLPLTSDLMLKRTDFYTVRAKYERSKLKWVKEAEARYVKLKSEIPTHLVASLVYMEMDWFERKLRNGPPKFPKNIKRDAAPINGLDEYHFEM